MRLLTSLIIYVFIFVGQTFAVQQSLDQRLTQFLQKYVHNGLVDYTAIQLNPAELNSLLAEFSAVTKAKYETWKDAKKISYLINYYNLATIQLIVEHYPVKSIKDIGGWFSSPWSIDFVSLFSEKVSLDYLEHTLIRKSFKEPRVHFALVCASIGCPILRSEAYTAENLDQQLDEQTKLYLHNSNGLQLNDEKKKVYISSIFKWYKEDFTSVVEFIQKYLEKDLNKYELDYIDYNWNLNNLKLK